MAHVDTSVRSFQGDVYADGDELRMQRRDELKPLLVKAGPSSFHGHFCTVLPRRRFCMHPPPSLSPSSSSSPPSPSRLSPSASPLPIPCAVRHMRAVASLFDEHTSRLHMAIGNFREADVVQTHGLLRQEADGEERNRSAIGRLQLTSRLDRRQRCRRMKRPEPVKRRHQLPLIGTVWCPSTWWAIAERLWFKADVPS